MPVGLFHLLERLRKREVKEAATCSKRRVSKRRIFRVLRHWDVK